MTNHRSLLIAIVFSLSTPAAVVAGDDVPEGLASADWSGIRQAYEASRHAAHPVADGYRARNPGQRWATTFDGRGFTTRPDTGAWTWGLQLVGYGFAGQERVVECPERVSAKGQGVTYDWDATLREWFVNDERGLEHGYTLHHRPPGRRTDEEPHSLTFVLAVRGELVPDVHGDERGVSFVDAGGAAMLTYSGLSVFDADGRTLPACIERVAEGLLLSMDERNAHYPLTIDPLVQLAYFKASNTDADDQFGRTIAVSGNTVVVGADREDSNATGLNGNQGDDSANASDAVYVFVRSETSWSQQAYLKASNTDAGDLFGWSMAMSGDTLVVGAVGEGSNATGVNGDSTDNSANGAGAAYVFVRNGTSWNQQAYLKASNTDAGDSFGQHVAVSGDTVVVGAYAEASSTTGVNGDQSDNSLLFAGAAYVFVRNGTTWSQQAYLKASNTDPIDSFGFRVAVSGDTAVVGARSECSNATGVNGDHSDNSATSAGAAYVFVRSGTSWSQEAYLKASNTDPGDGFGNSVAVSGDTVVVGATFEDSNATGVNGNQNNNSASSSGAAYVFVRNETSWSQQAYLKASNAESRDAFSLAMAMSGDTVVVGALDEDSDANGVNGNQSDNSTILAGAAYVFVRDGTIWNQHAYLKASNSDSFDRFSSSVAISENMVAVGAMNEDSNATGVDGDQSDNSTSDSGAAYVFELCPVVASSELVDLGFPPNPDAFRPGATSGPVIGAVWDPFIDHTTFVPLALIDFVRLNKVDTESGFAAAGPVLQVPLGASSGAVPADVIGTPICDLVHSRIKVRVPAGTPFAIRIPFDCSLVGTRWCAQGGSIDGAGVVWLANALEITIGSF